MGSAITYKIIIIIIIRSKVPFNFLVCKIDFTEMQHLVPSKTWA
jgi:hypothetical protein